MQLHHASGLVVNGFIQFPVHVRSGSRDRPEIPPAVPGRRLPRARVRARVEARDSVLFQMPDDPLLIPVPVEGRRFVAHRPVRLGDASPGGRLRLDAVARYLQDVADDDAGDAGLGGSSWVVRRTTIEVHRPPVLREVLEVTTFCSGVGGRWAERRTSITGGLGGRVEAVALWVHVDGSTGRPVTLPPAFDAAYASAHGGRQVRPRLQLGDPPERPEPSLPAPPDDVRPGVSPGAPEPFPLRASDFDVVGHVNNAVYWSALESVLARRRELRGPLRAVVEHRAALERTSVPFLDVRDEPDGARLWVLDVRRGAVERPGPGAWSPDGTQPVTVSAAGALWRTPAAESASTV